MYIRTKDGRIMEITLEEMSLPTKIGIHTEECVEGEYLGVEVIQQADTIEELCDMFVFRVGENVIIDQDNDKFFRGNWKCYDTIYGAIWTDKGLIYVAKMNEKGELELL